MFDAIAMPPLYWELEDYSGGVAIELGLGGTAYATSPLFWRQVLFLRKIALAGVSHFDTAPLYGAGRGERALGHAFGSLSNVRIVSKVGVPYRGMAIAGGSTYGKDSGSHAYSRASSFIELFPPESLENHLISSLERLKRPSIDGFLLHSPPGSIHLGPWVQALNESKAKGLTSKVGLSIDSPEALESLDFTGVDIIQIPASMVTHPTLRNLDELGIELHLNGVFRSLGISVEAFLEKMGRLPCRTIVLLGSRNFLRVKESFEAVRKWPGPGS